MTGARAAISAIRSRDSVALRAATASLCRTYSPALVLGALGAGAAAFAAGRGGAAAAAGAAGRGGALGGAVMV